MFIKFKNERRQKECFFTLKEAMELILDDDDSIEVDILVILPPGAS